MNRQQWVSYTGIVIMLFLLAITFIWHLSIGTKTIECN